MMHGMILCVLTAKFVSCRFTQVSLMLLLSKLQESTESGEQQLTSATKAPLKEGQLAESLHAMSSNETGIAVVDIADI